MKRSTEKMKKNIGFIYLIGLWFVLHPAVGYAKKDSLPKNISFVKHSQAWFSSSNAAGLHHFTLGKVAEMNSRFCKQNGEFVNYYQSNDSYRWGIGTQSFYRFNERIVFYGQLDYQNFTGKNMAGSIVINPEKTPFNIVELSDTTQGRKNKERYRLVGALSVSTKSNLHLGVKVAYKASNYTKHKDLRHRNKRLNLDASLGLSYAFAVLEIGANYLYSRNIEEIYFKSFGNTDRQYMHLVDFGNFYGRYELYSDSGDGYISGWGAKPIVSQSHALHLQTNIQLSEHFGFFNEFELTKGKGHFGTDESNSIVYTTHKQNHLSYKGIFSYTRQNHLHRVAIELATNTLINYENAYRRNTLPGQLSKVEYLGKMKVFERNKLDVHVHYVGYLHRHPFGAKWLLSLDVKASQRQQKTSLFPFYREQTIRFFQTQASMQRTFLQGKKQWRIGTQWAYAKGFGNPFSDHQRGTNITSGNAPKSADLHLFREYEYLTLARIIPQLTGTYGQLIKHNRFAYVKLAYTFVYAFENKYMRGNKQQVFELTIGVDF